MRDGKAAISGRVYTTSIIFLSDAFDVSKINKFVLEKIVFNAGKLMGNRDKVMSAKCRFINISR